MVARGSVIGVAALIALLCACPASAARNSTIVSSFVSTFVLTSTPTTAVASSNRVSEDQQFVKTWEIKEDTATVLTAFTTDLSGRVFFSHASTQLGDGVASRIKVSGTTIALVESVEIAFFESQTPTTDELVSIQRKVLNSQRGPLLVEVELARRNSLHTVLGMGTGDTVLLADVLYSSEHDPFLNASSNTSLLSSATTTTLAATRGRLFAADKTASVATGTVVLNANEGTVQLELAAIKTTNTIASSVQGTGNITLIVDDLGAEVTVRFSRKRSSGYACIADVSASSNTSFTVDGDAARVSYPSQDERPFLCTTLTVPERVPANAEAPASTPTSGAGATAELGMAAYTMAGLVSLLLAAVSAL